MAQRTRSRVSSVTWGSSLKTRDTVLALTPATRATSRMVVIEGSPPDLAPAQATAGFGPADSSHAAPAATGPPVGSGGPVAGHHTGGRLAAGLVDRRLAGRGAEVGLGDDGELGADLRGGRLAGQGRGGLVHPVGPEGVRRLGRERLHPALLPRG